ncbi:MAG: hypothetical protein L6W00_28525 [Lentisphaeria bacterium]|nr:MAG: hypothetical protein L6W00_28525 [Lentisphaeria bacterium]
MLYAVFKPDMPLPQFCDEAIPIWHLVYHGILTYNSDCGTVNAAISPDRKKMLRNLECGGRPLSYFYSKFTANNWMGEDDCACGTDEELARSVDAVARNAEEFSRLSDLQFEFIERHERLGGGLVPRGVLERHRAADQPRRHAPPGGRQGGRAALVPAHRS